MSTGQEDADTELGVVAKGEVVNPEAPLLLCTILHVSFATVSPPSSLARSMHMFNESTCRMMLAGAFEPLCRIVACDPSNPFVLVANSLTLSVSVSFSRPLEGVHPLTTDASCEAPTMSLLGIASDAPALLKLQEVAMV